VRGLRRGVDYDGYVRLVLFEEINNCGLIADVNVAVTVARKFCLQPSATPQRACLVAKKLAAHVIVDADDVQSLGSKNRDTSAPMRPAEPVTTATAIPLASSR
jgi:hypothetical protein